MLVWCPISISYMSAFARITSCECERQRISEETLMRHRDEPDNAESTANWDCSASRSYQLQI